jgi:hypothetical protein
MAPVITITCSSSGFNWIGIAATATGCRANLAAELVWGVQLGMLF